MRYYIIAGEASGDLHASNLMRELKRKDINASFRCWGGDLMQEQGAKIVKHYRDLAFMGFAEVVLNLRTILNNISFCKKDIQEYRPDVLILVDYPGFNLRIAGFAKRMGIKVVYYISPQIWAWKESRVNTIKKAVDKMLVILPFEKEFYAKHGYHVDFVGHPLLDAVINYDKNKNNSSRAAIVSEQDKRPIIALLPGSRKQEIKTMLPIMLSAEDHFPEYRFIIAAAPSQDISYYQQFLKGKSIQVVSGRTYDLLQVASAALVTSGTATLETALFNVPEVVCYKGNKLSYLIARSLVKIKFISLVNLIMDREIVRELIQDDLNTDCLVKEMKKILSPDGQLRMKEQFEQLRLKLGGSGASLKAAQLIIDYLSHS